MTSYGTHTKTLSPESRKILTRIATLDAGKLEATPRALAVAMEAFYILVRDTWEYGKPNVGDGFRMLPEKLIEMEKVYGEYAQKFDEVGALALEHDKERLILKTLPIYTKDILAETLYNKDFQKPEVLIMLKSRLQAVDPLQYEATRCTLFEERLDESALLAAGGNMPIPRAGIVRYCLERDEDKKYVDKVALSGRRPTRLVNYKLKEDLIPLWDAIQKGDEASLRKVTNYLLGFEADVSTRATFRRPSDLP